MVLPLLAAAGVLARGAAGAGQIADRGLSSMHGFGNMPNVSGIFGMFLGPVFRFFKWLVGGVIKIVGALVRIVIDAVLATVRFAVNQVVMRTSSRLMRDHPMWDLFINKHINWKRALLSLEDADDEQQRLVDELGDDDGNGVPDLYDQDVVRPEDDFLGIKFPDYLPVENDYVRYMPRDPFVEIPQPVNTGAKGLVRSETLSNTGHHCWVKWNELNPYGPADAPLWRCNSMDLYLLGHVYGAQLTR